MEKALTTFNFNGSDIRTFINKDKSTWFIAKDVCLTLKIKDTSQATKRLDDDEKGACFIRTPGGKQEVLAISESGLYTLILRSNKPEANRFRRWVTSEVLPAIRKNGSYTAPKAANPDPAWYPESSEEASLLSIGIRQALRRADQAAARLQVAGLSTEHLQEWCWLRIIAMHTKPQAREAMGLTWSQAGLLEKTAHTFGIRIPMVHKDRRGNIIRRFFDTCLMDARCGIEQDSNPFGALYRLTA